MTASEFGDLKQLIHNRIYPRDSIIFATKYCQKDKSIFRVLYLISLSSKFNLYIFMRQ
jgi:hypothetical protein